MRGRALARKPGASGAPGLVLWELAGAPAVSTWTQGLRPSGVLAPGETATVTVFDCATGSFHVAVVGRERAAVRLARDGATVARRLLGPREAWARTVPTTARGGRCVLSLTSTSPVRVADLSWRQAP
jgi:hypothetical protein